jgi:signal transduction histidine kinase
MSCEHLKCYCKFNRFYLEWSRNEDIKKKCQVIKYSSHSLLGSINDILDFSKIEKKELKLEKHNLAH